MFPEEACLTLHLDVSRRQFLLQYFGSPFEFASSLREFGVCKQQIFFLGLPLLPVCLHPGLFFLDFSVFQLHLLFVLCLHHPQELVLLVIDPLGVHIGCCWQIISFVLRLQLRDVIVLHERSNTGILRCHTADSGLALGLGEDKLSIDPGADVFQGIILAAQLALQHAVCLFELPSHQLRLKQPVFEFRYLLRRRHLLESMNLGLYTEVERFTAYKMLGSNFSTWDSRKLGIGQQLPDDFQSWPGGVLTQGLLQRRG
mmetsp:Transcript_142991/g.249540  ORF Transcript_142991/g.249540 Transcript_142991/m.249540 type:complete len:257 (-) Transcript_142991:475-1245(-)